jgi:hypothetical protein
MVFNALTVLRMFSFSISPATTCPLMMQGDAGSGTVTAR